jgi:hypothetical protein
MPTKQPFRVTVFGSLTLLLILCLPFLFGCSRRSGAGTLSPNAVPGYAWEYGELGSYCKVQLEPWQNHFGGQIGVSQASYSAVCRWTTGESSFTATGYRELATKLGADSSGPSADDSIHIVNFLATQGWELVSVSYVPSVLVQTYYLNLNNVMITQESNPIVYDHIFVFRRRVGR